MAGRPAASARETVDVNRESSFLDLIMRRLESGNDQGAASSSIESLDAPAMSPTNSANPWQYLSPSDPSSPILQRDFYNLTHSPLPSENPWMEQEQQRVPMLQADEVGQRGGARGTLLQRRRETINPDSDWASEVPGSHGPAAPPFDAMLYEELAAAWYRNGHLRAPAASPRSEGLQGMWEGLVQAYASVERWGNSSTNADFSSVNPQFDPNVRAFGRMGANDDIARWQQQQQSMPARCGADEQFAEFSNSEAADMDTRTVPSLPVDEGGNAIRSSSDILGSPNTSLLSGSGGDDSDDEECNDDPPSVLDSNKKRKTPVVSEDDDSRTSESSGLKNTAPLKGTSRPRKKRNTKRSREPRYAIKTRTDVDIMDDGFKWRKYGQKAVKNSPHPRNYYRCTTPHCPVRKRVERASEDSGMVITTYEGTHSHHTPGFIHRPAPERTPHPSNPPPGVGFGHRASSLLPLPPEFTTLAALHQMRSLQHILAQQQIQMPPMSGRLQRESLLRAQHFLAQQQMQMPPMPGRLQLESLLRAQQFLGLHDPDVKPGPFHNFDGNHFMGRHGFPYRPNFQTAPPMRPQPRPRTPEPQADGDLVRRVLEAEESARSVESPRESTDSPRMSAPQNDFVSQIQSSLRSRVELEARRRAALVERAASAPRASGPVSRTRSANSGERPPRRRAPSPTEDELVDGLLQEMAKRGESTSLSR